MKVFIILAMIFFCVGSVIWLIAYTALIRNDEIRGFEKNREVSMIYLLRLIEIRKHMHLFSQKTRRLIVVELVSSMSFPVSILLLLLAMIL